MTTFKTECVKIFKILVHGMLKLKKIKVFRWYNFITHILDIITFSWWPNALIGSYSFGSEYPYNTRKALNSYLYSITNSSNFPLYDWQWERGDYNPIYDFFTEIIVWLFQLRILAWNDPSSIPDSQTIFLYSYIFWKMDFLTDYFDPSTKTGSPK